MSPTRRWQRDLNDAQHRATAPASQLVEPIDLDQFVAAVLDGTHVETMDDACNAVLTALVAKIGRPLKDGERAKVYIATGAEFNRRRQATLARTDVGFAETIELLRDANRCPECGKTRAVFNVASRGFRAERITAETHCACPGGPAYAGIGSRAAS
jgi:hypothetical protein